MSEDLKLCKDCKHFYGDAEPVINYIPIIPKCLKTQIQEPVLGNFISRDCLSCRSDSSKCARQGKWWEEKENETNKARA